MTKVGGGSSFLCAEPPAFPAMLTVPLPGTKLSWLGDSCVCLEVVGLIQEGQCVQARVFTAFFCVHNRRLPHESPAQSQSLTRNGQNLKFEVSHTARLFSL